MKIETMKDAFIHELSDMLNAEKQLTKALPKMAKAAENPQLEKAFTTHKKETEEQIKLIEKVVKLCKIKLKREKCDAMAGLVKEGDQVIKEVDEGPVRDSMLIAAAQKVEHYEIASYGCLVSTATQLGFTEAAEILEQILDQEKQTDQKLNQLAEQGINREAGEQAQTSQKGNTMTYYNQNREDNGGRGRRGGSQGGSRERDDEGRFMSDDDYNDNNRSYSRSNRDDRYEDDYNDDYRSSSRDDDYDDEDQEYSSSDRNQDYDDRYSSGRGEGRGHGRGGWFGDSEGHAEAGRQSRGGQGRSNYSSGRDDRYYDDNRSRSGGRSSGGDGRGWFGDSEGHAEAGRQSHGGQGRGGSRSMSSRGGSNSSRSGGSSSRNGGSRGRSSGQGRGWFGDSEGHARAGRHSHDNDRSSSRR